MTSDRSRFLRGVAGLAFVATLACPSPKAKNPDRFVGKGAERVDPSLLPRRHPVDPKLPPNPTSYPFATVPEHSVGPFLARRPGAAAMGAFIGPGQGAAHRVISLPLGADGSPLDPRVLADVSEDATMLIVRPGGGDHGAYIAAWTALTDTGEALSVIGISAGGEARTTPVEITRTKDDIVWVEVVPTLEGEVAVWAEQPPDADANLFAQALEPDGRPRGLPSPIVRGVVGWQTVPTANGAGVAMLTRKTNSADTSKAGKETTIISWLSLDADARPVGPPLVIGSSTRRILDIDVARVGDRFVFAWTRRGAPEPAVIMASVDAAGALTPPQSITARSGGASLVDIVGGKHGGVLAWQETTHLARGTRRLHLVPVPASLPSAAGPPASPDSGVLDVDTAGSPEVVPLEHGYAVLARIRTCPEPAIPGVRCDKPASAPAFVRMDERFIVRETQPILLDETQDHARQAWGLSCEGADCLVLAAGPENPTEVRVVDLTPTANRWRAPLPTVPPADAPRVLAVDTVASADIYSELAVTTVNGAPLLAAITTESAPNNDGTRGASVSVAPLDRAGASHGASVTLTHRAIPEGGVAVAAAEGLEGGAVAWVGRENGHAAVHITRVDATGKRTNDIQLTTAGGDASDVALAWASGGWIVAWVDTRDGNGEVYVTKVDPSLRRIAREVRVTNAPGDASDVTVLTQPGRDGPVVWVAWADPRESPRDGVADIYVSRVRGTDATLLGPDTRVLATVPHSRSPTLAPGGGTGGPSIAWIEEAPVGADPGGASVYGAMIGALDASGRLLGEPLRVRGAAEGFPTSVAIDRDGRLLHVLLTRSTRDDMFLDAMTLVPGAPAKPYELFALEGPPSMDVSLAVLGDGIYFNDQSEGSTDGRIRRAAIEWQR
jgi:hypothetical protein